MEVKEKNKLMPELRFPEFMDGGEWEVKKLGEICNITNGKANAQDHVEKGKYPLFDRSEVIKASNEYIFDCEAVIIPGEGVRFIPKYYEGKFNLHQRAYALKDFKCNGKFIFHSMTQRSNLLSKRAVQSTVLSLRLPILQNFPIVISKKIQEQQKIATFLSNLDELIEAHKQKLELLKRHKKGLMQNLFPITNDQLRITNKAVPKWRFPEFRDDGEWVEKKLGELFDFGNGKNYKHLSTGDIPVYGTGGIMLTVNDYLYDGESVCIGRKGTIDKPIFLTGKFWTVDTLFYTHSFKNCIPKFIFYIFQNTHWYDYNEAGGVPSLSKKTISTIEVAIPTLKEQQKIASCLSSIDEIITAEAEKIEQLERHKKGLMQGLFPQLSAL